jgi:hypothetical protein
MPLPVHTLSAAADVQRHLYDNLRMDNASEEPECVDMEI